MRELGEHLELFRSLLVWQMCTVRNLTCRFSFYYWRKRRAQSRTADKPPAEELKRIEEHLEEVSTAQEEKEHHLEEEESPTKQTLEVDEQSEGDSPGEETTEDDKTRLVRDRPRRHSLEVHHGEERKIRRQHHVRRISLPQNASEKRRHSVDRQVAGREPAMIARSKGQELEQRQRAVAVAAAITAEHKRSSAPPKKSADWGKLTMVRVQVIVTAHSQLCALRIRMYRFE